MVTVDWTEIVGRCADDYKKITAEGEDKNPPTRDFIRAWMQTHYGTFKLSGRFFRKFGNAVATELSESFGRGSRGKKATDVTDANSSGLVSSGLANIRNFGDFARTIISLTDDDVVYDNDFHTSINKNDLAVKDECRGHYYDSGDSKNSGLMVNNCLDIDGTVFNVTFLAEPSRYNPSDSICVYFSCSADSKEIDGGTFAEICHGDWYDVNVLLNGFKGTWDSANRRRRSYDWRYSWLVKEGGIVALVGFIRAICDKESLPRCLKKMLDIMREESAYTNGDELVRKLFNYLCHGVDMKGLRQDDRSITESFGRGSRSKKGSDITDGVGVGFPSIRNFGDFARTIISLTGDEVTYDDEHDIDLDTGDIEVVGECRGHYFDDKDNPKDSQLSIVNCFDINGTKMDVVLTAFPCQRNGGAVTVYFTCITDSEEIGYAKFSAIIDGDYTKMDYLLNGERKWSSNPNNLWYSWRYDWLVKEGGIAALVGFIRAMADRKLVAESLGRLLNGIFTGDIDDGDEFVEEAFSNICANTDMQGLRRDNSLTESFGRGSRSKKGSDAVNISDDSLISFSDFDEFCRLFIEATKSDVMYEERESELEEIVESAGLRGYYTPGMSLSICFGCDLYGRIRNTRAVIPSCDLGIRLDITRMDDGKLALYFDGYSADYLDDEYGLCINNGGKIKMDDAGSPDDLRITFTYSSGGRFDISAIDGKTFGFLRNVVSVLKREADAGNDNVITRHMNDVDDDTDAGLNEVNMILRDLFAKAGWEPSMFRSRSVSESFARGSRGKKGTDAVKTSLLRIGTFDEFSELMMDKVGTEFTKDKDASVDKFNDKDVYFRDITFDVKAQRKRSDGETSLFEFGVAFECHTRGKRPNSVALQAYFNMLSYGDGSVNLIASSRDDVYTSDKATTPTDFWVDVKDIHEDEFRFLSKLVMSFQERKDYIADRMLSFLETTDNKPFHGRPETFSKEMFDELVNSCGWEPTLFKGSAISESFGRGSRSKKGTDVADVGFDFNDVETFSRGLSSALRSLEEKYASDSLRGDKSDYKISFFHRTDPKKHLKRSRGEDIVFHSVSEEISIDAIKEKRNKRGEVIATYVSHVAIQVRNDNNHEDSVAVSVEVQAPWGMNNLRITGGSNNTELTLLVDDNGELRFDEFIYNDSRRTSRRLPMGRRSLETIVGMLDSILGNYGEVVRKIQPLANTKVYKGYLESFNDLTRSVRERW